ncbi:MAG TPA: hypothetical protein VHD38_03080 [Candidatus Paceibacterota bacterium]|jgi:hypothetical protein|nr:hypothetical protein [Candidatus Paceibacterota bacterium]
MTEKAHDDHGSGGGTMGKALGLGVAAVIIGFGALIVIQGISNIAQGNPPFSNMTAASSNARTTGPFAGTPGGGYVPGAPRSPDECRARGGTDTGRGCSGFR